MGPRKGRKKFFKPSEEEKAAFELARIESKLKRDQKKQVRAEKIQKSVNQHKKMLLEQRKRFLKELEANPENKEVFEPNISKKLLVYSLFCPTLNVINSTALVHSIKNPGKVSPGLLNKFASLNVIGSESVKVSRPQGSGENEMLEEREVWGLKIIHEEIE